MQLLRQERIACCAVNDLSVVENTLIAFFNLKKKKRKQTDIKQTDKIIFISGSWKTTQKVTQTRTQLGFYACDSDLDSDSV